MSGPRSVMPAPHAVMPAPNAVMPAPHAVMPAKAGIVSAVGHGTQSQEDARFRGHDENVAGVTPLIFEGARDA